MLSLQAVHPTVGEARCDTMPSIPVFSYAMAVFSCWRWLIHLWFVEIHWCSKCQDFFSVFKLDTPNHRPTTKIHHNTQLPAPSPTPTTSPAPLPPRFFWKSCSFQAIMSKFWAQGPLGSKLSWPPWPKSWIRPCRPQWQACFFWGGEKDF